MTTLPTVSVADPGGGHPRRAPSLPPPYTDQKFLNFMQVFGKIWQICMLAPAPGGLASPPTRNHGSLCPLLCVYYGKTRFPHIYAAYTTPALD